MTAVSWILLFFFVCFAGLAFMFYASLRTQERALGAIREGQQGLLIALERLERVVNRLDADFFNLKAPSVHAQAPIPGNSAAAFPPASPKPHTALPDSPGSENSQELAPSSENATSPKANMDADEDWPDGPPPSSRRVIMGKSPMPEPWRNPIKNAAPQSGPDKKNNSADMPLERTLDRLNDRPQDLTRERLNHLDLSTPEPGERNTLPPLKL